MRVVLELQNVSKRFARGEEELVVLDRFSLQVSQGEITALAGPSGCGKTTILRLAAGLIRPDGGAVRLAPGIRLAHVFQEPRLLPWKTVAENIRFVQENFFSAEEAREIRERILIQTELWECRNAYPTQLSGGMKQRVELARALAVKPQLLLMDEPFKSLDLALQERLYRLLLEEQGRENFGVLLVTHSPYEAVLLARRIMVLSEKPVSIRRELVLDSTPLARTLKEEQVQNGLEELRALLAGGI